MHLNCDGKIIVLIIKANISPDEFQFKKIALKYWNIKIIFQMAQTIVHDILLTV